MSYILDALNKSDQERQRERAPNLKTIHVSSKSSPPVNRWKVAIFLLLMVNLVLAGIWLDGWMQQDSVVQVTEPPAAMVKTSKPATGERQSTASRAVINVRPAAVDATSVDTAPVDIAIPIQLLRPMPEDVPEIHQLPTLIQEQIPDLTFASHIYASNPRLRMVSINGRSMREGDGLSPDLILQQITEEGVILQFGDYLFRIRILRDWSFN